MAETFLSAQPERVSSAERYQVMVHVDAPMLARQPSVAADTTPKCCELDDGIGLPAETVRRLTCDGALVPVLDDAQGNPLNVGRRTRAIPPAVRRALRLRDNGCRFPGCIHRRYVEAHHIEHWAHSGETKLDNLLELCTRHHRLMHEGGFGVHTTDNGEVCFTHPAGWVIDSEPPDHGIDAYAPDLAAQHTAAGVAITPETCTPLGHEADMDYAMAVEGLLECDDRLDLIWCHPKLAGDA